MKLKLLVRFAAFAALFSSAVLFAQEAKLTADATVLLDSGGVITFTGTTTYGTTPGSLGWSIALPSGWSFVAVSGPQVPEVAPAAGATDAIEFAYTTTPDNRAAFTVSVRYPSGATAAKIRSSVIVRTNGKLTVLTPEAVSFPTVP